MNRLSPDDILPFLSILTILLVAARLTGEIFKRFRMPAVMGELFAGVLLGPSLLGTYAPGLYKAIFTDHGESSVAFDGLSHIGIILFLFVAGMEVDLLNLRRRGKAAAKISFSSSILAFSTGFLFTWFFYDRIFTITAGNRLVSSMFMGTALCITALSVAAKILVDLDLIKTRFGNMILTAAMVNDFSGWMLFAIVINVMSFQQIGSSLGQSILAIILFAVMLLTIGRVIIDKGFAWSNKHLSRPGGSIVFAIAMCLLGAIFTEWLGIHAIFGAFLMGVVVGASKNFEPQSKEVLHQFITNIFAPLFFVSIGLRLNFISNFDWQICLTILVLASFGKIVGGYIGARFSGFKPNKAWAMGFAMNIYGSQQIALGSIALQAKIIDEKIFVALVVMTMVTIMAAGPLIRFFLRRHEEHTKVTYAIERISKNKGLNPPNLPPLKEGI